MSQGVVCAHIPCFHRPSQIYCYHLFVLCKTSIKSIMHTIILLCIHSNDLHCSKLVALITDSVRVFLCWIVEGKKELWSQSILVEGGSRNWWSLRHSFTVLMVVYSRTSSAYGLTLHVGFLCIVRNTDWKEISSWDSQSKGR